MRKDLIKLWYYGLIWSSCKKHPMIYWILLKKSEEFGFVTDIDTWVSRPAPNKEAMSITNAKSASSICLSIQMNVYLSFCLLVRLYGCLSIYTQRASKWWRRYLFISYSKFCGRPGILNMQTRNIMSLPLCLTPPKHSAAITCHRSTAFSNRNSLRTSPNLDFLGRP